MQTPGCFLKRKLFNAHRDRVCQGNSFLNEYRFSPFPSEARAPRINFLSVHSNASQQHNETPLQLTNRTAYRECSETGSNTMVFSGPFLFAARSRRFSHDESSPGSSGGTCDNSLRQPIPDKPGYPLSIRTHAMALASHSVYDICRRQSTNRRTAKTHTYKRGK